MAPLSVALHNARDTFLVPRKSGTGFRGGYYGGGGGGGGSNWDEDEDGDGLTRGAIAGIVLGSIAFVVLLGFITTCFVQRHRRSRRMRQPAATKVFGRDSSESESRGPQVPPQAHTNQGPARRWTGPWGRQGPRRSPSYWMERRDEKEEKGDVVR